MSPAEILKWRSRIEAADVRGYFDEADDTAAMNWNRCAVGEQVKLFPKVVLFRSWGEPRDRVLANLGGEFGDVVRNSYRTRPGSDPYYAPLVVVSAPILRAYEILDLIEARVMVLRSAAA